MFSDADLILQISGIERELHTKQEILLDTEDFEEMCELVEEISALGSRLLDRNIRLRLYNRFHIPTIPEY